MNRWYSLTIIFRWSAPGSVQSYTCRDFPSQWTRMCVIQRGFALRALSVAWIPWTLSVKEGLHLWAEQTDFSSTKICRMQRRVQSSILGTNGRHLLTSVIVISWNKGQAFVDGRGPQDLQDNNYHKWSNLGKYKEFPVRHFTRKTAFENLWNLTGMLSLTQSLPQILLFKQDLHEESVENFKKCIEANDKHADCYCGMGNALIKIGRYVHVRSHNCVFQPCTKTICVWLLHRPHRGHSKADWLIETGIGLRCL